MKLAHLQSSPIPMSMQSLKKIGQKVLKLKHGNEVLMDGQTDGRMTDGRSNILVLWATSMLNSHRQVAPKT